MKVGIIGYGLMGKRRHKVLPAEDQVVICDPLYSDPVRPLTTIGSLEHACDCDATIVSVPTPSLYGVCVQALQNGARRILLEKPCGTSSAQVKHLYEEAERRCVPVVPAYTLRHYPGIIRMLTLADAMGDPLWASFAYVHGGGATGWRALKEGGGELLDQGSHLIDLALAFGVFSGPVRSAQLDHVECLDVEDHVRMSLGRAEMTASWTCWQPSFGARIMYKHAQLWCAGLGDPYGQHTLTLRSRDGATLEATCYGVPREAALMNEWRELLETTDNSRLLDAIRVLELIEEARRCAS